jgi:putative inorganic carbon (HCO3(-)) transporter
MSVESLLNLKLRSFISSFRAESAALWFLCLYILMEYIRPQAMYSFLDFLPWGEVSILLCFASVFLTGSKANGMGTLDRMFILFSLIVIWSSIFAWSPEQSLKGWTTYLSWMLLYFSVVSILTTPNRMFLFMLFFILINFKLSLHGTKSFAGRGFSFAGYGLVGSPGWFRNSGEYAMQMVIVFAISTTILLSLREYFERLRRWWLLMLMFPGTAFLTVIGSSSRGGQLALAAVIFVLIFKRKKIFKKIFVLGILVVIVLNFLPEHQLQRFTTMGHDRTSELRLMHWKNALDTIEHHPLGIGYHNWIPYYQTHYHPVKLEVIHNTILEAFVDLGIPGGILFLVMLSSAFIMNLRTMREMKEIDGPEEKIVAIIAKGVNIGLLGSILAAFFMSVLFYPMFWLAFATTSSLRQMSKKRIALQKEARERVGENQLGRSTVVLSK